MAMSLVLSMLLLVVEAIGWVSLDGLTRVLDRVNFNETLLHGMLGVLLFAGALHVRIDDLDQRRVPVQ